MAFNPNNPNGRAAASGSQPLVLSTEDKYVLDDIASKIDLIRGDTLNLDEPLTTLDANIRTQLTTLEGGLKGASSKTLTDLYNRLIAAPATEATLNDIKTLITTLNTYVDGVEGSLNTLNTKDFATQTTLAAVLAKIIAAPATEAKQDNIITKLSDMLTEMRDDVFVTAIYWEDRSSATAVFYREERIRNQDDGTVTTVYTRLSDNTVVGSLPAGVVLVQGANDRTIEAFRYKAIASGVDYSAGDWLTNTLIYDTDGGGEIISSNWYNLSTGDTLPSAPGGGDIQAEGETLLTSIAANIGAQNETVAASDTATSGINGLFKRLLQQFTTYLGRIPAALTGSGNFKVAVQEAIPAGNNNIGDVDVASLPSIPAGTNLIGKVKIGDGTYDLALLPLANSKPVPVAIVDGNGNQITSFSGGGGLGNTINNIDLNIKNTLDMLKHPHAFDPALGALRVIISSNGQAVTVTSGSVAITTAGAIAVDQSFNAWVTNNLNFNTAKNRIYG